MLVPFGKSNSLLEGGFLVGERFLVLEILSLRRSDICFVNWKCFRNHVKEQLTLWFDRLQQYNCNNFLVVHATFQVHTCLMFFFDHNAFLTEFLIRIQTIQYDREFPSQDKLH